MPSKRKSVKKAAAPKPPPAPTKDEAIQIAKQLRPDQGRDRLLEFLRK